jgi:hypothetical protein
MSTIRYRSCDQPDVICAYCDPHPPMPATWMVYGNPHNQNAVAMCTGHALSTLGAVWAMGDTAVVNGKECGVPAAFVPS